MTNNLPTDASLPKGIHQSWKLPNASLGALWDSIVMDEARKEQLLSQAIVNFTVRPKVERTVLPLHGVILLVGPPGTGKTPWRGAWRIVWLSLFPGEISLARSRATHADQFRNGQNAARCGRSLLTINR